MTTLLGLLLSAAVSAAQANAAAPRIDLSKLSDDQRGTFLQVAGDVQNYAGCQGTLLHCLGAGEKDGHALRMAILVTTLAQLGAPAPQLTDMVEKYYASFDPKARIALNTDALACEGKGPVTIAEFSDYQCPHCAAAAPLLDKLVVDDRKGKARLCAEYYPFPTHPRARIAAYCAEYARRHGKFWDMHRLLFQHQADLEDGALKGLATTIGLNADEMLAQAYGGKFDDPINAGVQTGVSNGVDSTPTLFFDGRRYALPVHPFFLQFSVDDELLWKKEKGWKFEAPKQAKK